MAASAGVIAVAGVLLPAKLLLKRRHPRRAHVQIDDALVALFSATNVAFIAIVALQAASSFLTLPQGRTPVIRAMTIVALAVQAGSGGDSRRRRGWVAATSCAAIALAEQNILGDLFAALSEEVVNSNATRVIIQRTAMPQASPNEPGEISASS